MKKLAVVLLALVLSGCTTIIIMQSPGATTDAPRTVDPTTETNLPVSLIPK